MMTFLDSMIGYVSPKAALNRALAREQLNFVKRNYDAATYGKKTKGWFAPKTSAQVETRISLPVLRDRSRELLRNAPIAVRAVDVMVNNVIGTGIVPTIVCDDKSKKKRIEEELKRFIENCSLEFGMDFYGVQALAFRSLLEGGEILVKFVRTKDPRNPLKIQLLESDFINPFQEGYLENGGFISQGVEFGPDGGTPVAYHLYKTHPGGFLFNIAAGESFRVPASEIVHCFRRLRPGQTRGIPFLASVMLKIRDLDLYSIAQLQKQKLSACYAAFVRDTSEQLDLGKKAEDEIESIEPGTVAYLPYGKEIQFSNPPEVPNYGEYVWTTQREIAQGLGISVESLSNDYSRVNFSSARMGWLEHHRTIQSYQWGTLIPGLLAPIMNEFLKVCSLKGVDTSGVSITFTPPRREMLDPTSEIKAMTDGIRSGIFSLSECIRELGYDPVERLTELANDKKLAESLGLNLDSLNQEKKDDAEKDISNSDSKKAA